MALSNEAIVSLIALFVAIATLMIEILRSLRGRHPGIGLCQLTTNEALGPRYEMEAPTRSIYELA